MTLPQILAVLRARWRLIAAVFALIAGAVFAAGLLRAPTYSATARVVLDLKPDPVSALAFGPMGPAAIVATQVEILRSERVAQAAIARLPAARKAALSAQWQERTGGGVPLEAWLVQTMARGLDVTPAREGSVIAVAFTAAEPQAAAEIANAFVEAYLEVALDLRVDPARQFSGFFEDRAKAAREALEQAQAKLSAFERAHGVVAGADRMDVEQARLNELGTQLAALQVAAAESNSRQTQAQGARADRIQEVMSNPVVAQLRADIGRTEAQLQQLGTRLGDNHPQVVETRATLSELRQRLEQETARVTGSVGVANSISRQREAEVRAALEAQRKRVAALRATRDDGLVLQRDVDAAQRAYDAIMQRLSQTRLESQSTQAQVNVLSRAQPPLAPSAPRPLLYAAIGALLGLLAAVSLALLLELADRRVRSSDDITAATGLPVLGRGGLGGGLGGARTLTLVVPAAAALPAPANRPQGA